MLKLLARLLSAPFVITFELGRVVIQSVLGLPPELPVAEDEPLRQATVEAVRKAQAAVEENRALAAEIAAEEDRIAQQQALSRRLRRVVQERARRDRQHELVADLDERDETPNPSELTLTTIPM